MLESYDYFKERNPKSQYYAKQKNSKEWRDRPIWQSSILGNLFMKE